ncbi:MAG: M16 family metallopeptidase [Fimbriimonas sp.]
MKCLSASVLLLALGAAAPAQQLKIEQYKLSNGMKVILHEDHALPIATINIWYAVGSKDEADKRSGFAHLFEHLMFMGTNRVPGSQFDQLMEGAGGKNNASTTVDRTNFYSSGPSNLLPMLLWLDADRMEALGKAMTQKKLDLQRDVVRNERRENTENTPYGEAYEAINGLVYPKGHPYSTGVIGSHKDLEAASVEDVKKFFATYYVPNNATLVVAGDFKPEEVKPLIAKWFGTLPRKKDVPRRTVPPITLNSVKRVTMTDQVQFAKTVMVWHSPAAYKPGDFAMQLAAGVLSNGLDSRLYERLVVKDKLASEVYAYPDPRMLGSLFFVDATATEGASLSKLEAAIDDELAKFRKEGPKPDELARVKAQVEFSLLNNLQSVENKADKLNEYQFYFGNADSFKRVLDMYRAVTPAQVKAVAAATLNPNKRLVLRVLPAKQPAPKPKPTPQKQQNPRDVRPRIPPEGPFKPIDPKEFTVNGMKIFYWHRPELPLMSIATVFVGGSERDPASAAGRSAMMADMLDEGAGTRTASQFENALEQLGATFGASAGYLATTASMSVISSNFGSALTLYADALIRPRFDAAEWERVKRTTVAALEQEVDDPTTVARQVALREYFGWEHPYGRPVTGTAATVSKLTVAELKERYASLVQPGNATFFVAGSLPEDQVRSFLARSFGGWSTDRPAPEPPKVSAPEPKPLRVVIVDKPGAVQTVVRFLLPGWPYSDPRRLRLKALGTLLGGSFTSRLNANLRENKGYTYGVGADYIFEQPLGYFIATSSVRADVTGPSVTEFLKELRSLKSGNVKAEEAEKVRAIQRTAFVQSMGDLGTVIGTAIRLYLQGRPFADLGTELAQISKLNAADLNALTKEALDLDHGVLVLVGQKDLIFKQIASLGLPKAEIVEPVK